MKIVFTVNYPIFTSEENNQLKYLYCKLKIIYIKMVKEIKLSAQRRSMEKR